MNQLPNRDLIAGIVLDAVGTLIKPVPSVAEAYTASARRQGLNLDVELVRTRFRRHFHEDSTRSGLEPHATDETAERERWIGIVRMVLPEVPDHSRAFDELWEHFARPGSWRCFPDVKPALETWRSAGLSICIGSNFDARLRDVVRGLSELDGLEDRLVISSEVGFRKPHPAFFRAACDHLNLEPQRVLCVGDDPENDVHGARRAGLAAVLVHRGDGKPDGECQVPDLSSLVASWRTPS